MSTSSVTVFCSGTVAAAEQMDNEGPEGGEKVQQEVKGVEGDLDGARHSYRERWMQSSDPEHKAENQGVAEDIQLGLKHPNVIIQLKNIQIKYLIATLSKNSFSIVNIMCCQMKS